LGLQRQHESARASLAARDFEKGIRGLETVAGSDYSGAGQARTELDQARKDYAADLVGRAEAAAAEKHWSEVEQLARLATSQDPRSGPAYRLLGTALNRLRRYAEARDTLKTATALDARDANGFNQLGWAHVNGHGGDLSVADSAFRQATALDPKLANAVAGLGQLQLARNQTAQARATLQQALAINPDEAAAYQGLGQVAMREKDYGNAAAQLREAVGRLPDEPRFHLDLADALDAQKQFPAAKAELDRARELAPDDPDVDYAFGEHYGQAQQYTPALSAYDAAIARRPDDPDYHVGRGYILLFLTRYADCLEEGRKATELGAVSPGNLLQAYALREQGRIPEARSAARLALDADPDNAGAQDLLNRLAGR
jgi:tetratricopeptide (TPR) repeat protein